jgi:hypothetical protein
LHLAQAFELERCLPLLGAAQQGLSHVQCIGIRPHRQPVARLLSLTDGDLEAAIGVSLKRLTLEVAVALQPLRRPERARVGAEAEQVRVALRAAEPVARARVEARAAVDVVRVVEPDLRRFCVTELEPGGLSRLGGVSQEAAREPDHITKTLGAVEVVVRRRIECPVARGLEPVAKVVPGTSVVAHAGLLGSADLCGNAV